jgi:hypothetical protein
MKNSIVKYDYITHGKYNVQDYTSKKVRDISTLPELSSPTYIDYYTIINDDKYERISHELYGTSDYWDLLVLINSKDPLFDIPWNSDIVNLISDTLVSNYNNGVFGGRLPIYHLEHLSDITLEEVDTNNESNRVIKYIKPNMLQTFMKILRDNGII